MIYFQSFLALLAVLSLVWILYRLFVRFQARLGLGGASRQIKVLERAPLGDKRTLLLVDLGGRRFLVGSTPQNLNLLAELSALEATVPSEDDASSEETPSFRGLLAAEEGAA